MLLHRLIHVAVAVALACQTATASSPPRPRKRAPGPSLSDEEQSLLAARQFHPRRQATPAFVYIGRRQAGPSSTPCPIGSQHAEDGTCVSCASLGRVDNTAAGQPCGGCIDSDEEVGQDGVCRLPPCDDPNATPLPEGGCGVCVDGYTRVDGRDECVSCESLDLPDGTGGACGSACAAPFVLNPATGQCSCALGSQASGDTCVTCSSLERTGNAVLDEPCGGCINPEQEVGEDEVCRLPACDDPNATPLPEGGCGVCADGFTRVVEGAQCVSCESLNLPDGTGGTCGTECSPPFVLDPTTRACSCPINSAPTSSDACTTCAELHRIDSGLYGSCGQCLDGYVDVAGTCTQTVDVINPGFELGASGVAPPWGITGSAFITSNAAACYAGNRCYASNGSRQPADALVQTVNLQPFSPYVVTWHAWVTNRAGRPAFFRVLVARTSDGAVVYDSEDINNQVPQDQVWVEGTTAIFATDYTGQVQIRIETFCEAGFWLVDEVHAVLQQEPYVYDVLNPGFETGSAPWTITGSAFVTIGGSACYQGARCFAANGSREPADTVSQTVQLQPNSGYTINWHAWVTNRRDRPAFFSVLVTRPSDGALLYDSGDINSAFTAENIWVDGTTSPFGTDWSGQIQVRFSTFCEAGFFLIDEVHAVLR